MQKSYVVPYSEILLKSFDHRASGDSKQRSKPFTDDESDDIESLEKFEPNRPIKPLADTEPLVFLPYQQEVSAKKEALVEFLKRNRLPGKPEPIVASPLPRHYRTTTKRRVYFLHGKFRLRFSHRKEAASDTAMLCSALEPKEHDAIYRFLLEKINSPSFAISAKHLNYIIIRGTYTEFCVIFNVHRLSGPIVRNLKALGENLQRLGINIVSALIFFDPTRSDYYLEKSDSGGAWKYKILFGPDTLRLKVSDQSYQFKPVSFSQINQSILPAFLDTTARLCRPDPAGRLLDLYCGYGLFAIFIGKHFKETYAVDVDPDSIECGEKSGAYAMRTEKLAGRMRFRVAPITLASLESLLPPEGTMPETILLDPPAGGPAKDVIYYCCSRKPVRVVHLFCDIDRLPIDIAEWRRGGYWVKSIVPFDMFPGTPSLEVAVLLEPMSPLTKTESNFEGRHKSKPRANINNRNQGPG